LTVEVISFLDSGDNIEPVPNALFQVPRSHTFEVIAAHETHEGFQSVVSSNVSSFSV
jgi:hypothetical protein